ncbi:MAG TPA: hypothetical protein VFQ36_12535 [Ktedonobacteraceae bacterium]|nr:hypothetical protein [Ktedonobacteraceae bacterium]
MIRLRGRQVRHVPALHIAADVGVLAGHVQFKDQAGAEQDEEQERRRDHQRPKDPPFPLAFMGKPGVKMPFQALTMRARRGVQFSKRRERDVHLPGELQ